MTLASGADGDANRILFLRRRTADEPRTNTRTNAVHSTDRGLGSSKRVISVDSVTRTYGTLQPVDGLSFTVGRGSVVGFNDPNGAGKTTTLQCMVGIQAPTACSMCVDGMAPEVETVMSAHR